MDADHAATDQGGPEPTAGRDPASAYWPCIETCSFIQQNLSESSRSALEPEPKQWVSIWDDKTSNRTFSSTIQKLASAFALLLCDRPGPDFITACTIEVPRRLVDAKGSRAFKPSYIVRVAQNRQFTDAQINEIQNFVNNFVSVVLEESPTQPENASSSAPEDDIDILGEKTNQLLNIVIERCKTKIDSLQSKPLLEWVDEVFEKSSFARKAWEELKKLHGPEIADDVSRHLLVVADAAKGVVPVSVAINAARYLTHGKAEKVVRAMMSDLDYHWVGFGIRMSRNTLTGLQGAGEGVEEEIADIEETKRSAPYRYLLKLARYQTATARIFQYLRKLKRKHILFLDTFVIKPTYDFQASLSGVQDGSPETFHDFSTTISEYTTLSEETRKMFAPLEAQWNAVRERPRLLHCELQLILFYLFNKSSATTPGHLSIGSFIGVSTYTCSLCRLIIESLRDPSFGFTKDFQVAGTHDKYVQNWLFPHLQHIQDHTVSSSDYSSSESTTFFNPCQNTGCECPTISHDDMQKLELQLSKIQERLTTCLRGDLQQALRFIHQAEVHSRISAESDDEDI